MRSERSKQAFLRKSAALSALSGDDLQRLASETSLVRVPRSAFLWRQGEPAKHVYWIRSGIVKISRVYSGVREWTLALRRKRDFMGEACLLGSTRHVDSGEAYEDLLAYTAPSHVLLSFVEERADVALELARLVQARRAHVERRISAVLFEPATVRLASLLVELAGEFGVRDSRGVILALRLPHKEIAAMIGTSRETVTVSLRALRKEGCVQTDGRRIVILDMHALRAWGDA